MNKKKYLHRKGQDDKKWRIHNNRTKKNWGDETPFRESIRDTHKNESRYFWNWQTGLDFTPTGKYLEENINRDWDEIYSDVIKKIKPKYRYQLEDYLDWYVCDVMIIDYIPYIGKYNRSRMAINWLFVDEEGILRNYKTKKDILDMARRKIRRDKLIKIQEFLDEEADM